MTCAPPNRCAMDGAWHSKRGFLQLTGSQERATSRAFTTPANGFFAHFRCSSS